MATRDVSARASADMPATDTDSRGEIGEFLASHGGPFYALQERLKLLHARALNSGSRAALFVGLAWAVPLVLGLPASLSIESDHGRYLMDPGAWAKFFIAIAAFVLAEEQVERGLRIKLRHFIQAPLLAPEAIPLAAKAVSTALRQRDSRVAELVCLVIALATGLASVINLGRADTTSWAVSHASDANTITAAGWWTVWVSTPLFVFLLLRGLWRHFVWAQLLRKIAGMELRLVATHPDGKGGLAFLAEYPNAYMFFVFGMSSAIAAAIAKHLLHETLSMTTFTMVLGGWLAIVLALFAYPLSAFSLPLARLKASTLLVLSAQGTRFHRAAERKVLGRNVLADATPETDSDIQDPTKQFETARKLSSMLVSREAIVPLAAAALIPFAVAGSTKLPYKEVFTVLKKLLLL